MKTKILITGATGFVGKNLVNKCLKQNYDIAITYQNFKKAKELFHNNVTYINTNSNYLLLEGIKNFNPEICVHLAANLNRNVETLEDIDDLLDANLVFTCKLLECLKNTNIKHFINTGTCSEYFNKCDDNIIYGNQTINPLPLNLYTLTKTLSRSIVDFYLDDLKCNISTIIPNNVYGENDEKRMIFEIIYDSLGAETTTFLQSGSKQLDFIHVDDVVDFYLSVIDYHRKVKMPLKNEYHCATGKLTSIISLIYAFEAETNKNANVILTKKYYTTRKNVEKHTYPFYWKPKISLREGIKRFILLKRGKQHDKNYTTAKNSS